MTHDWRPDASFETLRLRAKAMQAIRSFFEREQVLEVDVPVMGRSSVSDPFLDTLSVWHFDSTQQQFGYLQTSPEFFMKRLLAAGIGDIYFLGKAFRDDALTKRHNPEFTMLEWYRCGFTDDTLSDEVFTLIQCLTQVLESDATKTPVKYIKRSYASVFSSVTGINPHQADADDLAQYSKEHIDIHFDHASKSTWLDLIFSHMIEPTLQGCVCLYDYPKEQCALARLGVNSDGHKVAKRFEIYFNGIELANGYHELTCVDEYLIRFNEDTRVRKQNNLAPVALDQKFVDALKNGLPECAGVALGVDRLLMCLLNFNHISQTLPFSMKSL